MAIQKRLYNHPIDNENTSKATKTLRGKYLSMLTLGRKKEASSCSYSKLGFYHPSCCSELTSAAGHLCR